MITKEEKQEKRWLERLEKVRESIIILFKKDYEENFEEVMKNAMFLIRSIEPKEFIKRIENFANRQYKEKTEQADFDKQMLAITLGLEVEIYNLETSNRKKAFVNEEPLIGPSEEQVCLFSWQQNIFRLYLIITLLVNSNRDLYTTELMGILEMCEMIYGKFELLKEKVKERKQEILDEINK